MISMRCVKGSMAVVKKWSVCNLNAKCRFGRHFSSMSNAKTNHSLIRNVGIVAHIDAGKTTTSEQMLFACGSINNVGRVDSGDTVMDFLPQERERGITISSAAISLKWKQYMINLIDTPGHVDFTIEVERSARVLDGAVIVLDAVSGVQAQTKTVWKQVKKQSIPSIAFINKMDRDGASFQRAMKSIATKLNTNPIAIQYPIGKEENFLGVVDLLSMTKMTWPSSDHAPSSSRTPSPPVSEALTESDAYYQDVIAARKVMLEQIADVDEIFLNLFLESDGNDIPINEIIDALRRVCLKNTAVPTICGASLRGKGVEPLLNCITTFLPSPLDRPPQRAINTQNNKTIDISPESRDLCALAFKIVYDKERGPLVYVRTYSGTISAKQMIRNSKRNIKERANQLLQISADDTEIINEISAGSVGCIVGLKETRTGDTIIAEKGPYTSFVLDGLSIPPPVFSLSIEPEKSSQAKDLEAALKILSIEDPSLIVEINKESGQTILRGIGELHLEIVCDKIRRDHNIEVTTGRSYVAFRETIISTSSVEPIEKHIVYNKTIGTKRMFAEVDFLVTSIDHTQDAKMNIMPEVKTKLTADEYTALVDGLQSGFTRGPLGYPVVGVLVTVTKIEKDTDTTPGAVRACAAMLVDSVLKSHREILEPIMSAEIDVPVQYVGDVLSDLSVQRRGHIGDVITEAGRSVIMAEVPLESMLGYATIIRSMTHGEGMFSLEYSKHSAVDISTMQNSWF